MAEALLRLDHVSKVFAGGHVGLESIDLDIAQGEFLSLLGPSGCGKTTTLRVIAGFESPTQGRVLLDGQDMTALRPCDRPINTVFQDYALFPHMNVSQNIAFGLSLRRVGSAEIRRRVKEVLELVGLPDKVQARIGSLSGGQKQRVALARALVCQPRLLLLDEPLSALDASLREHMQTELKRLQKELGTTFVMVTHDQTEALSISDRIVVMNAGRIEQIAPPDVLYDRPATQFVASFIGTMNLLRALPTQKQNGRIRFAIGPFWQPVIALDGTTLLPPDRAVTLGIRPEDLVLTELKGDEVLNTTVLSVAFHGRSLRVQVEAAGGQALFADIPREGEQARLVPGQAIGLALKKDVRPPVFMH
ncbi:ABC transporter ATP-binding protein [Acetobacter peroxydans]|uniref:Spermidine/putrescine ABC transporter n=1 Tax=Acetobacter peroxydans TaxID=104098 RepID=A0A4Y3TW34_9PROT|nr:ABC transporter ATP-binding protein [Acetobacter peroxydans]NHO16531.1 ATP-binding cassette domain-containing protein [Acetobacter peroxydans]GBR32991.1 nitrate/sulfonate/bicarbonate transporter ATP-binding protein [Acetobacter peroxydans NBRC 13755]GBR42796.1 nitrate/sulfonate/bicarbonate transporter ATP-binding protein [Acetobacter peroxydans]GEB85210.1 spermidine/putrescine ABC transporter [Acetobacter peroxydans]